MKKIICKPINGKIPAQAQLKLDLFIGLLDGKEVEIIVRKKTTKRSIAQNALYWLWMTLLGKEIGHTKEAMHLTFKRQFLRDKLDPLAVDEFIEYLKKQLSDIEATTRKLTKDEMTQYLNQIEEQANEIGIKLPHPEDQGFWEYYEQNFD